MGVWDAPGPNWRPAAVCGRPWPAVGALRCEEPQTYRGRVPSVSHPSRSSRRSCSSGLVSAVCCGELAAADFRCITARVGGGSAASVGLTIRVPVLASAEARQAAAS